MQTAPDSFDRFSLHGCALELRCDAPFLRDAVARLLAPFWVEALPEGFMPVSGAILPFDESTVMRNISSSATRVSNGDDPIGIYQDGERFWIVDERCGMAEINLLRGQWRSWIIPAPTLDPVRACDALVLGPLAQLLRRKHLHLLPGVAVTRGGWGVLLLASFALEPELRSLMNAGYRIVAQRWAAVREEGGRIEMMHLPGQVERQFSPMLRGSAAGEPQWVDLDDDREGAAQNHTFCDAVLMAEPGRRPEAHLNELPAPRAVETMRENWPILELHPSRRAPQLPLKLAQFTRCCQLQLSRNPGDLLMLLDSLRCSRTGRFVPGAIAAAGRNELLGGAAPVNSPSAFSHRPSLPPPPRQVA